MPESHDKHDAPTPRTDAFSKAKYDNSCAAAAQGDAPGVFGYEESPEQAYGDALEFARQLERDLAESHQTIAEYGVALRKACALSAIEPSVTPKEWRALVDAAREDGRLSATPDRNAK